MTTNGTRHPAVLDDLQREIDSLLRVEVHVETNQGTYGATEAGRKVGTSDPAFANREVYETVAGTRRETGPSEERAPGRMRRVNAGQMSRLRADLKHLRTRLREIKGAL